MKFITSLLSVVAVAVAVAADIKHCPKYCSCTDEGSSGINAVCTRLSADEQEFVDVVQHLTVTPENITTPIALTDYLFKNLGLRSLESLKIVNTMLTDITEKTFLGLPSLYDINLSNNQLFLIHPETFANNTNLRRLKLSGNPMQLIQVLQPWQSYLLRSPSLNEFDLSNCQLSKVLPKTFTQMRNLIFVNLSSNFLKFIPGDLFESLQYVEELDLSGNMITKLDNDTFVHNTELSSLKLRKNPIEALNGLNITSLDELDLSYCKLSILMRETLEGIPHVTILNLSNNQIAVISDDTFTALRDLKKLDLSDNKLIGPLPKDLFKNNNDLEVLSLSGNKELGDFVQDTGFLEHHSAMQRLLVAGCGLTRLTAGQLSGMDDLNELNVSNNAIRELDDSTFASLKRLNTLDLSNNRLQSLSVQLFAGNADLIKLRLNGNPLKYLTHYAFSHTPLLKYLDASNCELHRLWDSHKHDDDDDDDAHQLLTNLVHLDISSNKLRDLHAADFAHMKQLEVVDIRGNPLQCLTTTVEVVNLLDSQLVVPFRQTENVEPRKVRWDELLEGICPLQKSSPGHAAAAAAVAAAAEQPKPSTKKTLVLENTHASYTKVDEIVVETDSNAAVAMWPMLLSVSALLVSLYLIVYLFGELTHRRRAVAATYARPGLGGHVRSRDASGSPLYYKLYEECSIPDQQTKKKSYVLDFSPIHTILKKNTTYKVMKNNEVNV